MSEPYGPSDPEFLTTPAEPAPTQSGGAGFRRYALTVISLDWVVLVAVVVAALVVGSPTANQVAAICAIAGVGLVGLATMLAGGASALGPTDPVRHLPRDGYGRRDTPFPKDPLGTRIAGVLLGAAAAPIIAAVLVLALG